MYEGDPVTVSVDSRVMVDADFFWKMNPNYSRPRADLAGNRIRNASGGTPLPLPRPVQSEDVEPAELREDDLLIYCPTVLGFSFGEKLWAEFAVADIKEIEWSSLPFDCLSIPEELTRNSLGSMFLHKLEYCQYDDLTKVAREHVWRNFLSLTTTASGDVDVTGKELDKLAIYKLNGRQIKNIMSVAQAFATKEGSKSRFPHAKKAVKANDKLFREFYGKDFVNANYG
ncbi:hypothetical protein ACEPPN_010917 [Leptodophora sp. 'Broadleaf-Isolate-01']